MRTDRDDESFEYAIGQVLALIIILAGVAGLTVILFGYGWRLGQWASGWLW